MADGGAARRGFWRTPGAWILGAFAIVAGALGGGAIGISWWSEVEADRIEREWRAEMAALPPGVAREVMAAETDDLVPEINVAADADVGSVRAALTAAKEVAGGWKRPRDGMRLDRLRRSAAILSLLGRLDGAPRLASARGRATLAIGWAAVATAALKAEASIEGRSWPEARPLVEAAQAQEHRGLGSLIADSLAPHPYWVAEQLIDALGRSRLMLLACAARLHRIEQGSLPARAEDLVPRYLDSIPLDPYIDAPISWQIDPATGSLRLRLARGLLGGRAPAETTVAPR